MRPLSTSERLDWLRLYRSENVGPVTFYRLIDQFGTPGQALAALPELARNGGSKRSIHVCSKAAAEREMEAIETLGARLLVSADPGFPSLLRALEIAPLLIARGNDHLLARPSVAIVGARNASVIGRKIAQQLAQELGASGLIITSGMARGIDSAAHQGALPTGTVAVLAGGVDVIYPAENTQLYHQICASGVAVSEMPPLTQPQANHFPRRNRLISGMAMGVVVVEASPRSGSLITARLAIDHGREVFAVPGSPMDPRCQGPNSLIKEGATLVETSQDVLDVIDSLLRRPPVMGEPGPGSGFRKDGFGQSDARQLAEARRNVLLALSPAPVTVDEILRQCQLSPSLVSLVLLELELAGRLERHPGHKVSLVA